VEKGNYLKKKIFDPTQQTNKQNGGEFGTLLFL
jgi:hypothetical protein